MADEQGEVLIPVEQTLVSFHERHIVAVRLSDGRVAAVLSSLCDALQMLTRGQARRIHADDVLSEQLLPARIETSGGPQTMDVLTAWAIPTWLRSAPVSWTVLCV
ncbi:MAG: hypothetical protein OJF49_002236 [Ktedonobacterales bacterium]|jgi:hypothetical protein|nr:MAG: hypothetical protein OJF49_002236 [Ktedonobacterales bacterium]